ncbi:predicted protein [Phaeodactylum tricornutum CCAP 1055/1]|uniref:Potassium channel domain-containing protein n=2 Tax=Phaeodactylum tricornutum TaxID=2850 RepID=B7FPE4_PHATC|nr:predicted protein [Phaeodactylum tricornutum CCAP 1055/1]EEC51161.1 predicted protein [Phaeodactylum tricornutum CCAP 1055/1]|eukprot:XP_002176698.1 predicted protein [Phaeodactylum tricornutum CCAP 1055/1]
MTALTVRGTQQSIPLDEGDTTSRPDQSQVNRWLRRVGCGCIERLSDHWPRSHGIIFGIILPLWLLIGLSGAFGYGLSTSEAGPEIAANNDQLASFARARVLSSLISKIATHSPTLCFRVFLETEASDYLTEQISVIVVENQSSEIRLMKALEIETMFLSPSAMPLFPEKSIVNASETLSFLEQCSEQILPRIQALFQSLATDSIGAFDALTFNWNRCNDALTEAFLNVSQSGLNPLSISDTFASDNQNSDGSESQRLFNIYLIEQNLTLNNSPLSEVLQARVNAFGKSIHGASGELACHVNIPAAGKKITERIIVVLVYGDGILCFGGILGSAGYIANAISDHALIRFRLRWLTTPWKASFIWASLYYMWLFFIAVYFQRWQNERVDELVSLMDSYWLAYISTTTVGLGDFFFQPEGLRVSDLATLPLLFLFGFILLAGFVGKFAEAVTSPFKMLGSSIVDKLKETNKFWEDASEEEAPVGPDLINKAAEEASEAT